MTPSSTRSAPPARDPLHISPDDPQRSRLFPRGTLVGMGLLCAATLALVYPGRDLLQLLADSSDNALAIDYLRHLVKLRGNDAQLRLMLSERYLRAGRDQAALDTLSGLHDPEADALRLRVWSRRWYDARALGLVAQAEQARAALLPLLQSSRPADFSQWQQTLQLLQGLDDPAAVSRLAQQITRFLPLPPTAAQQAAQTLLGLGQQKLAAQVWLAALRLPLSPAERQTAQQNAAAALLASGDPALAWRDMAAALGSPRDLPTAQLLARLALGAGQPRAAADVLKSALQLPLTTAQRRQVIAAMSAALLAAGDPLAAYRETAAAVGPSPDAATAWTLVRLALAANQPRQAGKWLRDAMNFAQPAAQLARSSTAEQRELAWMVLLADGDLKTAVHLADAALAASPGNRGWAERRAQALEWSGRPDAAMQQWIALLRQRYSDHALAELHRLALALYSSSGLDFYWQQRAAHTAMSADDWLQYAQALEIRGHPEQAAATLRDAAKDHPKVLSALGWLLGNMGEVEASLAAYAQALQRGTLTLQSSIDYATTLIGMGRFEDARQELLATQNLPGSAALQAAHQGLLGDLSWDMGQEGSAFAAYTSLWDGHDLRPLMREHQIQRLVVLTQRKQGDAAALRLLPAAWAANPSPALGLLWLQSLVREPSADGLTQWERAVLGSVAGKPLLQQPQMYAARAQVFKALGRTAQALADLRTALRLSPGQPDNQIALLWMEIDAGDLTALRADLPRYAGSLQRLPDGLDVLSAAAQTLGDTPQALRYAQQLYPRRKGDALWLVNYGDLLAQSGDERRSRAAYDRAWALLQARARATAKAPARADGKNLDALLARLRLAHGRLSGPAQQRLLDELRQRLRSGELGAQQTLQANAAIADWLLRLDTNSAARWWLARAVLTPAARQSIELQMALRDGNREQVATLLDQGAARHLLPQDKPEAERIAGRPMQALAQAEAVLENAAERGQDNPALQALARQTAEQELALADRATAAVDHREIDAVTRQGPRLKLSLQLGGQWRVQARVERQSLRSNNAAALTGLPTRWTDVRVGAAWQGENSAADVDLLHNTAVGSLSGLAAGAQTRLPGGLIARLQAEYHGVADESGPLQVAGRRDRLQLQLSKDFGRFWANLSTAAMRYSTRNGDPLGDGRSTQWEAGLWLRRGQPDLAVKLLGYSTVFDPKAGPPLPAYAPLVPGGAAPGASFFIPAGDDAYGFGLAFNMAQADTYSRRWWPYAEVDVLQSRRLGLTSGLNLGVHGPVFGGDQLSLSYQRQQNTSGLNRQWSLQYRIWFGR